MMAAILDEPLISEGTSRLGSEATVSSGEDSARASRRPRSAIARKDTRGSVVASHLSSACRTSSFIFREPQSGAENPNRVRYLPPSGTDSEFLGQSHRP